jgi:hypothetical protein
MNAAVKLIRASSDSSRRRQGRECEQQDHQREPLPPRQGMVKRSAVRAPVAVPPGNTTIGISSGSGPGESQISAWTSTVRAIASSASLMPRSRRTTSIA